MRKTKVALINNCEYCIFPEGVSDIKEFIEFINHRYNSFVELEVYSDEGCIAPFFIEENLKTETEYINTSYIRNIRECEISILKREEYEERLRAVVRDKCIHCVHYSEDVCGEDSGAFIGHISLNGECYEYEKK